MNRTAILRISREPNWIGGFRIEYDGKYIALFGKDREYPGWGYGDQNEVWYEEMCFGGAFAEGRNLSPEIVKETDEFVYINIGDERESLAWTKLTDDAIYSKVFEPCEY